MENIEKACVNEIRKGGLFDFINLHGHELSKDQLKDLVKELDYAIWKAKEEHEILSSEYNFILNTCVDSLVENRSWCEDDIEEEEVG